MKQVLDKVTLAHYFVILTSNPLGITLLVGTILFIYITGLVFATMGRTNNTAKTKPSFKELYGSIICLSLVGW